METETNQITEKITEETDDIALLEKYDNRSRRKADDVISMQTAVCIITVIVLFGLNYFYPEICIFKKLKELAFSCNEIFSNPIDLIAELL